MNRWDRVGCLFLLSMIGLIIFGLTRIKTNTEDVLQWLPDQSDARVDYNFFKRNFDSDDFVILTWQGCTTEDARLKLVAEQIRAADTDGLISKVTTGLDVTRQLGEQLGLSRKAIMRRMQGVFFGSKDIEATCVLVELSHQGTSQRAGVMELIFESIDKVESLPAEKVSMAGYPYIATYIDQELAGSYRTLLIPSMILATVISLLCLRNVTLGAIVFVTSIGAAAASVAITPVLGYQLGGLMAIIPALVFVLATSGAIHLIRYSLDCIGDPAALLSIGWKPCVISTATTAVGMLSLTRSEFPAIRDFGLFCAIGVFFALAFQLVVVPWLLYRFGQRGQTAMAARKDDGRFWKWLAENVYRSRIGVSASFLILITLGISGLCWLTAEVEVEKLFRSDSSIIASLTKLEAELGPMDQTEVLVVFSDKDVSQMPRRLAFIREVQAELKKEDCVGVAYSLVNFLPGEPKKQSARSFLKTAAYHEFLANERENLASSGLFAIDSETGEEMWRISVRFPFTEDVDFEVLKRQVMLATDRVSQRFVSAAKSAELENGVDEGSAQPFTAPRFIYTGHTYLFHHAQLTLLADLFQNFLLAFVIITPMLVVVLRSVKIGLIAMLPNIFPTVAVFGSLGWLGYPIDLALAMTASVALGIAVDDTTHFLIRFREHGGSLANMNGPVQKTIAQCGPAMLHTTLIASASLLTFYFSSMLVVSRFSWAISSLLVVALVADVLMLPATLFLLGKNCSSSAEESSAPDFGDA